jgi:hypothetical protein
VRSTALLQSIVQHPEPKSGAEDALSRGLERGLEEGLEQGLEAASTTSVASRIDTFIHDNAVPLMLGEALLFVLGGIVLWRAARRRTVQQSGDGLDAMKGVQQSVDTLAVEIERIAEHQRYATKVLQEHLVPELPVRPANEGVVVRGRSST